MDEMLINLDKEIIVTVIVPIFNEEKYIEKCIHSILRQDYSIERLEVLFVDGMSNDKTKGLVNHYTDKYPKTIRLIENPHKTVPYAMNIGIRNSNGKYIIRLDAHSEYSNDYISKCISTLEKTDSDNVGGLVLTKGQGTIGEVFARVLSSKFGVGNSGFRTNAVSGYVDTVPFGAFKRETFQKYGMYDERLTRNQDYELNYRIRKNGGKVYLNSSIILTYFCRNNIKDILKQSYDNGRWNVITSRLCPGSMSIRHFVPLLFLLSLIIMPIFIALAPFSRWLFVFEMILYLLLDLIFSIKMALKIRHIPILLVMFPIFHISYGLGSLIGLIDIKV